MTNKSAASIVDIDHVEVGTQSSNFLLSEHAKQLEEIRGLIQKSDGFHKKYLEKLRAAIVGLFRLGLALEKDGLLKDFYINNGERWGEKAKNNPFHALVTIAFEHSVRDELLSKYRGILRYAHYAEFTPEKLDDELFDCGIENTYKDAVEFFNRDFESAYEETEDERFNRATKALNNRSIGSKIKLPMGKKPDGVYRGFSTAVIKITGDHAQIVDFIPNQSPQLITSNVAALVKPMGARVRTKLTCKDMYWMFSLSDIFGRFVLDQKQAQHWELARRQKLRRSKGAANEILDQPAFIEKIKKQAATKRPKFKGQTLLQFAHNDGVWIAETLSNYPAFPVVQFQFEASNERMLNTDWSIVLGDKNAADFNQSFLQFTDWSLGQFPDGHQLQSKSDNALDIPIPRFSASMRAKEQWRSLPKVLKTRHEFTSSDIDLYEIWGWETKHKGSKPYSRNINFPKIIAIELVGDEFWVRFPKHPDQRRRLGVLDTDQPKSAEQAQPSEPIGFIGYNLLHKVTKVARDYSVHFEGCFIEDKRGFVALRFSAQGFHCDLSITIPLTSSLQGDTHEVSTLI